MMRTRTIMGFVGNATAGKTTLANAIKELTGGRAQVISFSEPLYDILEMHGLSREEIMDQSARMRPHQKLNGRTIRDALNDLGSAGRSAVHPDVWLNCAVARMSDDAPIVIFENVRFENEYLKMRELGAHMIGISGGMVRGNRGDDYVPTLMKQVDHIVTVNFDNPLETASTILATIDFVPPIERLSIVSSNGS